MPATLALTLGTLPAFSAFMPGVARDYNAIGYRHRALDGR